MSEQAIVFRHIGDGVYAGFDGYHIILKANSPYSEHAVYLEYSVMESLKKYAKQRFESEGDE